MKSYYVGLSTVLCHDFKFSPAAPVFETLSEPGSLVYCVSDRVIPPPDRNIIILPESKVQQYAAQMKQYMDRLRAGLETSSLQADVQHELAEEARTVDPEQQEMTERMLSIFKRMGFEGSSKISLQEERLASKVDEILVSPLDFLKEKNSSEKYERVLSERAGLCDGGAAVNFQIETGIPYHGSGKLLFDVYVAGNLDADLVTNYETELNVKKAKELVKVITQGNVIEYLTFGTLPYNRF